MIGRARYPNTSLVPKAHVLGHPLGSSSPWLWIDLLELVDGRGEPMAAYRNAAVGLSARKVVTSMTWDPSTFSCTLAVDVSPNLDGLVIPRGNDVGAPRDATLSFPSEAPSVCV